MAPKEEAGKEKKEIVESHLDHAADQTAMATKTETEHEVIQSNLEQAAAVAAMSSSGEEHLPPPAKAARKDGDTDDL